ncbi:uncharacterized protein LOC131188530 [Ahaetulla prasina]|uniref:uncharacterized protein LOC131188530 n=1 Tax=Ahaetulla prasina TaxID=499056 RepID=UPI00264A432F|nr:uncharacterized protein LOC131188530 [Ahaetulla prasina]
MGLLLCGMEDISVLQIKMTSCKRRRTFSSFIMISEKNTDPPPTCATIKDETPRSPELPLVPRRGCIYTKLEDHQDQNAKCEEGKITNSVGSVAFGCFMYKSIYGPEVYCPLRDNTQLTKELFFFKAKFLTLSFEKKPGAYCWSIIVHQYNGIYPATQERCWVLQNGHITAPILLHYAFLFNVYYYVSEVFGEKNVLLKYLRELGKMCNQHTEDIFTH